MSQLFDRYMSPHLAGFSLQVFIPWSFDLNDMGFLALRDSWSAMFVSRSLDLYGSLRFAGFSPQTFMSWSFDLILYGLAGLLVFYPLYRLFDHDLYGSPRLPGFSPQVFTS